MVVDIAIRIRLSYEAKTRSPFEKETHRSLGTVVDGPENPASRETECKGSTVQKGGDETGKQQRREQELQEIRQQQKKQVFQVKQSRTSWLGLWHMPKEKLHRSLGARQHVRLRPPLLRQ